MLAGSGGEAFQFPHGSEFFLGLFLLCRFQKRNDVVFEASGCNGTADHRYQFAEIVVGSRGFHRPSRWCFQFQHMWSESPGRTHGYVIEAALTFGMYLQKCLKAFSPITVVGTLRSSLRGSIPIKLSRRPLVWSMKPNVW